MVVAGQLDTYCELQRLLESRDAHGGPAGGWTTYGTTWASIEELKAEERVEANRVKGIRTHKIRIHHNPDVLSRHRLKDVDTGRIFNIDGVVDSRRRGMETLLLCVEDDV